MTYRLPSAWDPGFALPDNVRAEGLQRRAFVSKWARRGTYDDPAVGDAGYALPQYVKDERYGRGVYTTGWLPSGSTPGGHVPNYLNQRPQTVAATPAPGGGTKFTVATPTGAVPVAYQNYGRKAASIVLRKLAAVPPSARPRQLKNALDGIDRKLHPRAMAATRALGSLHAGVAHAFGSTLLEQVIETGRRGRAPKSGLMGLAGCARSGSATALGAVPTKAVTLLAGTQRSALLAKFLPLAKTGPGGITAGTCDSTGTYIWDAGGFWRRLMAGEQCGSVSSDPSLAPTTGGAHGGVTVTDSGGKVIGGVKLAPTITPGTTKLIQVGPFTFPLVNNMTIHWGGLLPDDWRAAINQQITRDCSPCIESSMRDASPGTTLGLLRTFLGPEMPTTINHDFFGINPGAVNLSGLNPTSQMLAQNVATLSLKPTQPIAKTVRPDNGETWALYATMEPQDPSKPLDATTNPWNLRITWRKADSSVWGWIWTVLSTIVDWVGDAIDAIGSLTCDILGNPIGQVGAVAGGAAVGGAGGAKAGAAGAQIGAQLCAQPAPAPVDTAGSSMGPLILIGAGVAAAALILTSKKKKAP